MIHKRRSEMRNDECSGQSSFIAVDNFEAKGCAASATESDDLHLLIVSGDLTAESCGTQSA